MKIRIFKNKWFSKFSINEGIEDKKLRQIAKEVLEGKVDADYGGGVVKKRIARLNQGKSSGYRAIILYQRGDKLFYVHGFAKKKLDNINESDERHYKKLAKVVFAMSEEELKFAIINHEFEEIKYDEEKDT